MDEMTVNRKALLAAVLLGIAFLAMYHNVLEKLVFDWSTNDDYSHGFLIVPISAYLAWERRQRFLAAAQQPSASGLIVVIGSMGVLLLGILGSELFLTRISIIGTVTGAVLFMFGWRRLRVMAF